jgi:hypothetical protein
MLRNVTDLRGYAIRATDGVIGHVDDVYFDDQNWGMRYLVVKTGNWLSGRKVLISPIALGHAGWMARQLPVAMTRAQVERSPDFDTAKPVSRQHEAEIFMHYGYPYDWTGEGLWGMDVYPRDLLSQAGGGEAWQTQLRRSASGPDECHLRSSNAVIGHRVEAIDGGVGHLMDLLVDDRTWKIHYLVVRTRNWWRGRRLLVEPRAVSRVSWSERTVAVHTSRQAVEDAPAYEAMAPEHRQTPADSQKSGSRRRPS